MYSWFYDDLPTHARAYRELSLLTEKDRLDVRHFRGIIFYISFQIIGRDPRKL